MKKKIAAILGAAIFLSGCSLPGIFSKKFAALQITTTPKADVYLNEEKVGETPFKSEKLKSEEYKIKLIPVEDGFEQFNTSVTLQPNLTTVIDFNFSRNPDESSGYILNLEKILDESATEIAVVSIPDNASLKLDGQPKGFTPIQLKSINQGDHSLLISAPGYKQKQINIKTIDGHKLTVDVQLEREALLAEEASPSAEEKIEEEEEGEEVKPSPTPKTSQPASPSAQLNKPYVEILDTPTGWLRVRSAPTTAEDNEVEKINPGETYKYLESNDTGWHKILLNDSTEGWISGKYAKIFK